MLTLNVHGEKLTILRRDLGEHGICTVLCFAREFPAGHGTIDLGVIEIACFGWTPQALAAELLKAQPEISK